MFLLVSLSKSTFFTRVALVSLVQHLCRTHVANVAFMLHLCHSYHICVARVWHSCCILDQIKVTVVKNCWVLTLTIIIITDPVVAIKCNATSDFNIQSLWCHCLDIISPIIFLLEKVWQNRFVNQCNREIVRKAVMSLIRKMLTKMLLHIHLSN